MFSHLKTLNNDHHLRLLFHFERTKKFFLIQIQTQCIRTWTDELFHLCAHSKNLDVHRMRGKTKNSCIFIHHSISVCLENVKHCTLQTQKGKWKVNDNNDKNKCIKSCVAATGCCCAAFSSHPFLIIIRSSTECVYRKKKHKNISSLLVVRRARHYWTPKKKATRRRREDRTNHQKYLQEWSLAKNLINLISFCVHRLLLLFNFHHHNGLDLLCLCFSSPWAFFLLLLCLNHALDTYNKSS